MALERAVKILFVILSLCLCSLAQTTINAGKITGGSWGLGNGPGGGGGGCSSVSSTEVPLVDLTTGCYQPGVNTTTGAAAGPTYQGGLYPGGVNTLIAASAQADSDSRNDAATLQALCCTGANPKQILMISIGMSIANFNFGQLHTNWVNSSVVRKSPQLTFIQAAMAGWNGCVWINATATPASYGCPLGPAAPGSGPGSLNPYDFILSNFISKINTCGTNHTTTCTESDVAVVLYQDTNTRPPNAAPCTGNGTPAGIGWVDASGTVNPCLAQSDMIINEEQMGSTARAVKARYPNAKFFLMVGRNYSPANPVSNPTNWQFNSEPFPYQNDLAVKHVIEAQLHALYGVGTDDGFPTTVCSGCMTGDMSLTFAPRVLWLGYTWANGTNPRGTDSLEWCHGVAPCTEQDYQSDFVHPSPDGSTKWSTGTSSVQSSNGTWPGIFNLMFNSTSVVGPYTFPWFHN